MHQFLKFIFGMKHYIVLDSSSLHHQEVFTVHTAKRTGIPFLCVQWKTPDDGQRNCPKHVEFYSKNKFEKLVHLVGFIIIIYHDARSAECQIQIYQLQYKHFAVFIFIFT